MIYAGSGSEGVVRSFNVENGFPASTDTTVADPSFTGGVRVASADFTSDGIPDLVAALGPGGTPTIQVFDALTGEAVPGPLGSFEAFESTFTGGVFVATGDVDGDGVDDIIAGAGAGGGPRVRVFSGVDGEELASFFAFETTFTGGVSVSAADLTGDGKAEVVAGAGVGGGPRVKVIDPTTGDAIAGPLGSFFAFDTLTHSGVSVATSSLFGDVDADGTPDVVVGTQDGPASRVKVYSGADGSVLADFAPFGSGVGAAVSVGVAYIDDDDAADVVVAAQDSSGTVRVFAGDTGSMIAGDAGEFLPFDPPTGGVSIAGGNNPYPVWEQPTGLPVVMLQVGDPTSSEAGESTGAFVFSRTGSMKAALTVAFAVRTETGDAIRGTDYVLVDSKGTVLTADEVVIPENKASEFVLVKPINEELFEGVLEPVFVTVQVDPAYTIDEEDYEGFVTILDDDTAVKDKGQVMTGIPIVHIGAADANASEDGPSTGAFTLGVTGDGGTVLAQDVTVYYAVSVGGPSDATPGDDYASISAPEGDPVVHIGSKTMPAGTSRFTFHVNAFDDEVAEVAENVTVTILGGKSGYTVSTNGNSNTAAVAIADNEPLIKSVQWKQLSSFLAGTLDSNPNVGGGIRIFAEKNTPTDKAARGQVRVNVQLDKRLPNKLVRFALYDVDDPSANGKNNVVDDEALSQDNRGWGTEVNTQFRSFRDSNKTCP